jgi:bifunctional non-homologous end joining protein LigD
VRDNAGKRWIYVGHVGTGFDQAALKSLHATMQPLRTDKRPFDRKVKDEGATTWLKPALVGVRHPVFLGFRTDKKALDVVRE